MKAFIVRTGIRIHPFGDPVADTPVLNRPLKEWQTDLFRSNEIEPVFVDSMAEIQGATAGREPEFFLTWDNVFVSPRLFHLFLRRLATIGGTRALAIRKSAFTDFTRPIQELREGKDEKGEFLIYHFYRIQDGAFDPSRLDDAPGVPIEMREMSLGMNLGLSRNLPKTNFRFPVTNRVAMEIRSWFHIWQLNLVSMLVWWSDYLKNPRKAAWTLLKVVYGFATSVTDLALGFLAGRPPRPSPTYFTWHALAQANAVGLGTRIHPTAIVLGSALGRNVEVGPFAFVAFSILGDNTTVSAFSQIRNSVVGPGCNLIHGALLNMCVLYPEARVCKVQASLLGRGSNYGGEVRAYDVKLTGPILIEHEGKLVSTGTSSLGICVGHGAALWGRVSVQHGRVIPNNYTIVENQENVIHRVPTGLPTDGPLMSHKGSVVPVKGYGSHQGPQG